MILKSLLINNYGPFAFPTKILFDENVTVLTGQNDTGKSSVLRLLRMIADGTSLQEDDVNVNHIYEANSPWDDDDNIHCQLILSQIDVFYIIKGNHPGKKILLKRSPPHSVFSVR
jgi:predicted ATP-dependent endonuclease of OLD family